MKLNFAYKVLIEMLIAAEVTNGAFGRAYGKDAAGAGVVGLKQEEEIASAAAPRSARLPSPLPDRRSLSEQEFGLYSVGFCILGACGDGNAANHYLLTPTKIADGLVPFNVTDVKQIVAGFRYVAVVLKNGSVYTTGAEEGGNSMCRDPTPVDASRFGLVPSLPSANNGTAKVVKLAAGWNHLLLLGDDGNVYGCGQSYKYQLGSSLQAERLVSSPKKIVGLPEGEIDDVAAGGDSSIFVTKSRGAWGVGYNNRGQLGLPLPVDGTPSVVQDITQLPDLTDIAKICLGHWHTVFSSTVPADAHVIRTVGQNHRGQLGCDCGSGADHTVNAINLTQAISKIACGLETSFALLADGSVVSAGETNSNGRAGPANEFHRVQPEGNSFTKLFAGSKSYSSFFKNATGSMFATGGNGNRQLGLDDATTKQTLEQVTLITGVSGVGVAEQSNMFLVAPEIPEDPVPALPASSTTTLPTETFTNLTAVAVDENTNEIDLTFERSSGWPEDRIRIFAPNNVTRECKEVYADEEEVSSYYVTHRAGTEAPSPSGGGRELVTKILNVIEANITKALGSIFYQKTPGDNSAGSIEMCVAYELLHGTGLVVGWEVTKLELAVDMSNSTFALTAGARSDAVSNQTAAFNNIYKVDVYVCPGPADVDRPSAAMAIEQNEKFSICCVVSNATEVEIASLTIDSARNGNNADLLPYVRVTDNVPLTGLVDVVKGKNAGGGPAYTTDGRRVTVLDLLALALFFEGENPRIELGGTAKLAFYSPGGRRLLKEEREAAIVLRGLQQQGGDGDGDDDAGIAPLRLEIAMSPTNDDVADEDVSHNIFHGKGGEDGAEATTDAGLAVGADGGDLETYSAAYHANEKSLGLAAAAALGAAAVLGIAALF